MMLAIQADLEMQMDIEEPANAREARERLHSCQDAIDSIEYQLSDPNKTDDKGERLSNRKYHKWRRQATKALHAKMVELRYLKRWLQAHERQVKAQELDVDPTSDRSLLVGAYNLLKALVREGKITEQKRLDLVNLIEEHIMGMKTEP